ncbi:hypothetical protein [Natranaeroarchaeum aerophilus]|uniref:Uncharacterized protein n=1 Tax=Natranaeroarchaeum aerophilus TaxID=2917711 RepID=A0AAE3FLD3_9EURY|nr:hypothetical protein [Natranaeroarchaeum aerophilus]MCL9812042.1 hypothetical protein [Natranaeroarchaeum aerophilus]
MEIDPDPQAEREADEVAERVVKGDEIGLDSMWYTDVHVQRTGAGAPIPGAGGSLAEQTLEEDAEDEDEGFSFRELFASMTKSGMAAGSVAAAVQAVAIEVGMSDPQTAMTIGSAGALLSAGVAGKINAYGQLDPQVLRRAFAAAGQEEFLAEILKHLGYEPEWADYGGDDDYNYGGD